MIRQIILSILLISKASGLTCRVGFAIPVGGVQNHSIQECPGSMTDPMCLAVKGDVGLSNSGLSAEIYSCQNRSICSDTTCASLTAQYPTLEFASLPSCSPVKCCKGDNCNNMRYDSIVVEATTEKPTTNYPTTASVATEATPVGTEAERKTTKSAATGDLTGSNSPLFTLLVKLSTTNSPNLKSSTSRISTPIMTSQPPTNSNLSPTSLMVSTTTGLISMILENIKNSSAAQCVSFCTIAITLLANVLFFML